jgi:hypothetical protein
MVKNKKIELCEEEYDVSKIKTKNLLIEYSYRFEKTEFWALGTLGLVLFALALRGANMMKSFGEFISVAIISVLCAITLYAAYKRKKEINTFEVRRSSIPIRDIIDYKVIEK